MITSQIKLPLRRARNLFFGWKAQRYIAEKALLNGEVCSRTFDFYAFKRQVMGFIQSSQVDASGVRFLYSNSCAHPTLYASAYACMTISLLGELQGADIRKKSTWVDYFNSFQSEVDGLFYDSVVMNKHYQDSDWWGARHLALHMLSAYTDLGSRPRYPFKYLSNYYSNTTLKAWLDGVDWYGRSLGDGDLDNKIMNIGTQLQFQRDVWHDSDAAEAIDYLKRYLRDKINVQTGMWGRFDTADHEQRSRMVQFAYHLFLLYFYDDDFDFDHDRIVAQVLRTQNRYGGYGVQINSSACEDIDSIDLLARFAAYVAPSMREAIDRSLARALTWIMLNQMVDGGFVFRLVEPFHYGSPNTSSLANVGAMFPTWFRTLALAYLTRHLDLEQGFSFTKAPGYEI